MPALTLSGILLYGTRLPVLLPTKVTPSLPPAPELELVGDRQGGTPAPTSRPHQPVSGITAAVPHHTPEGRVMQQARINLCSKAKLAHPPPPPNIPQRFSSVNLNYAQTTSVKRRKGWKKKQKNNKKKNANVQQQINTQSK